MCLNFEERIVAHPQSSASMSKPTTSAVLHRQASWLVMSLYVKLQPSPGFLFFFPPTAFISLFLNALLFFLLWTWEALNGLLFNAFAVLNIKDAEIKVNLNLKQDRWDQAMKIINHWKTMTKGRERKKHKDIAQLKRPYCVKSMVHSV